MTTTAAPIPATRTCSPSTTARANAARAVRSLVERLLAPAPAVSPAQISWVVPVKEPWNLELPPRRA